MIAYKMAISCLYLVQNKKSTHISKQSTDVNVATFSDDTQPHWQVELYEINLMYALLP